MDFTDACPRYEAAFELLGKRWTGLILRSLIPGPRRFSEIGGYVEGLSDRVLSQRLGELEAAGVVVRRVDAGRIEYGLTAQGEALRPVLAAVQAWADEWVDLPDPVMQGLR